jgi:hypothetical protein
MSPARVERIRRIRTRVAASAAALFVALFGLIGVQLASGHDPALSSSASNARSTTTTTTDEGDDQLTTSDEPSQDVSPVTTSQS